MVFILVICSLKKVYPIKNKYGIYIIYEPFDLF
nr:MAG TPA: hypothetical protein [Caudoviricetes sp.]